MKNQIKTSLLHFYSLGHHMLVLPTLKSADIMRTSLYHIPKVQNWSFCCRKSWFYFNDNSTRKYFDSSLIFYREKVDKKFCCQSSWVCPHSEHVEMPLCRREKISMESQFLKHGLKWLNMVQNAFLTQLTIFFKCRKWPGPEGSKVTRIR